MTILIFNPHSPYGERLLLADLKTKRHTFQSTLPMRGATGRTGWKIGSVLFQSTLPMRGATSDCLRTTRSRWNFNPHSPCGERLLLFVRMYFGTLFQSTLPMRGATSVTSCAEVVPVFQSTLPMRGATANIAKTIFVNLYDLSRSRGSIINI